MNKVYDLYERCVMHLHGTDTDTPHGLIENAVEVLADVPELKDVWKDCVFHINNWNENAIDEQCQKADVLIEELSGYLGDYFNR